MLGGNFQIYSVLLLDNILASPKIESSHLYSCLTGKTLPKTIITTQAEGNYSERTEKVTKVKLVKVVVTSFDKSHHLCTLHFFVYCFAIP